MYTKRIIPCLDVKDGRVVKGVNFINLKDAGDPVEVARVYDKEGDTEACDVLRHYTVLKGRLMPYLWAQANKTHNEGIPMMRSMVIAFTGDVACKYIDQQYMLGDNLCIVPVMNEEGEGRLYDDATNVDILKYSLTFVIIQSCSSSVNVGNIGNARHLL